MKAPISEHWRSLTPRQAWASIALAMLLELPVRWIVRPDMPFLRPGNPWFNLQLRIANELGFVLVVIAGAIVLRARPSAWGVALRRWTRWEWIAFATIGAIELAIVIAAAGARWPRLAEAGFLGSGL
ncbi:MAG: hypothetical protein AB1772_12595, partial [Candidatus Zixiibacteriota bacterium]